MKIALASVSVADQAAALTFYTEKLGFEKKKDIRFDNARWLTVVSPEDPDGPELLLEPNAGYPPMHALKEALRADGIPFTAFEVGDLDAEYRRLSGAGVTFTVPPTEGTGENYAIFDDTCGNLIQIYETIA